MIREAKNRDAWRSIWLLCWAQSVLGAQMPINFILGGLAGSMLAQTPALATLPISLIVAGSMMTAPVLSWIMGRWGRRLGFLIGAAAGIIGALLAAQALFLGSFLLFCAASLFVGVYMSSAGFYRFAAADQASETLRPRAISTVMAGGLVAAILGPEVVILFQDMAAPTPFAGAYLALVPLCLIGAIPLFWLRIPPPQRTPPGQRAGRPWPEILSQRRVPVAMICAMISYALMNLVMTSTPLAMIGCGFAANDAASVVRIHVLCMYGPSFFTGPLIARFGASRIIAIGLCLLGIGALIALEGVAMTNFTVALALVGLGWNFGFIGATAMLTSAHRPEERARVQGINDFLVFGLVTIASFSSGALMAELGWNAVLVATLPVIALAGGLLLLLRLHESKPRRAQAKRPSDNA